MFLLEKKTTALFVLIPFLLQGCMKNQGLSSAEAILSRDTAEVNHEDVDGEPPLFCYKSLGDVDCYRDEIPGRRNQLVSVYPPAAPNRKDLLSADDNKIILEPIEKIAPPQDPPKSRPIDIR